MSNVAGTTSVATVEETRDEELGFDRSELAESVYKWLWLAGMILVLSFFLPAAEGRLTSRSRPSSVQGWQLAQLAHLAAWYTPQMPQDVERRTYPIPAVAVWGISTAGVAANWLVLFAAGLGLYGMTRPDPRTYIRWASRAALFAGLCAISSTTLWFSARAITPQIGAFLWNAAPLVLAFGFSRVSRRGFEG